MPELLAGNEDTVACARDLLSPLANDAVRAAIEASPADWPRAAMELVAIAKDVLAKDGIRAAKAQRSK